jgi:putative flippase GtrA
MIRFIKAQASSLTATAVDFLLTIFLTEVMGVWYAAANVAGVVSGGFVNFYINRDWVFNGREDALRSQVFRYITVWCGNFLLNALGVWLLTQYAQCNYVLSKIVISLLVGWSYNYVLQKNYVFK